MYKNRTQVRDEKIRIYLNPAEKAEIESAADDVGYERAAFIRDAALVLSRYILSKKIKGQQNLLRQLEARLHSDQINYLLA